MNQVGRGTVREIKHLSNILLFEPRGQMVTSVKPEEWCLGKA